MVLSPGHAATHALLVGVSSYSRSEPLKRQRIKAPDLPAARNDVELMGELLPRLAGEPVRSSVLLNERATYDNVISKLTRLAETTQPEDSVVLYFTLHGASIYEDGKLKARALLLWDQELPGRALRHRFEQIPARDKTLIVDSCFAAGADKGIGAVGAPIAKSVVVHRESTGDEPDTDFLGELAAAGDGAKGFGGDRPYLVLAACPETVPAYAAPFSAGTGDGRWLSAFTLGLYRSLALKSVPADRLERTLRSNTEELLASLELTQLPLALGKQPEPGSLFGAGPRQPLAATRIAAKRWAIPVGLAAAIGPGSEFRVVGNRDVLLEVDSAEWSTCQASVTRGALAGTSHPVLFVTGQLPSLRPTRHARKGDALGDLLSVDTGAIEAEWLKPAYSVGDRMSFEITPKRAGWLSLLLVSGDDLQLLLPTSKRRARRVGANEIVSDAVLGMHLTAQPPLGTEQLIAVLTKRPPEWPVALGHPATNLSDLTEEQLQEALAGGPAAIAAVEVRQ